MKKLILLLFLLTLGWQAEIAAQKAVFPYNYPSKKTLKSLVVEDSPKGKAYGDYLLYAVNLALADTSLIVTRGNINVLFDNLYSEEYFLSESEYTNSGYDEVKKRIVPSVGHQWKGFVWFLRIGTYTIPLIKTDCGNVLVAKAIRTKVPIQECVSAQPAQPAQPVQSVIGPKIERIPMPLYQEPMERIQKAVTDIPPSPKKEIRIWKIVIPFAAIAVASICYFSRREPPHQSSPVIDRRDGGQGQDPPPSGGENGGQGQDPPPSGD